MLTSPSLVANPPHLQPQYNPQAIFAFGSGWFKYAAAVAVPTVLFVLFADLCSVFFSNRQTCQHRAVLKHLLEDKNTTFPYHPVY